MEDRVIIALAILIAMALVAAGLITKKLVERERFRQRQMGRGKSAEQSSLEPAE
jgi:hypothetical protein